MIKKILLLFCFLSVSLLTFGQDKITPSASFEAGYENRKNTIFQPDSLINLGITPSFELKPFYGLLYMDISYKGLNLYTSNKTYFNKANSIYFNPLLSEFKIGINYKYNNFSVGYDHLCSHTLSGKFYNESYDRIFLRIKLF